MSRFQILNAVLAMMSSFHPLSADWELVKHGRSLFEIRLREGPSAAELYAAEELRDHIEKMTGARLPLKTARNFPQSVLLISRPDDAGVRADSKALADESYQLLVDDRRVVIRGGSPRGQLYGVYSFLERLGCRWFTPKVSRIPRRLTLKLEGLDIVERPAFEYREIFCLEAFNGTWSARNRLNGNQHRMAARQGGGLRFGRAGVHTLHSLLPPEELFAEHPEFFPLIGKARSYRKAQICLSSTRARTVAAEQLKTWIREQPEAKYFSVSQMDWGGTCQCAPCIQADKEESRGLPYRAWSGGFLRFANEMASRIEKDFPDRFVTTLAYGLTEAPPAKVRPAKNVRVRFCAIRACQVHPWEKCTLPATTDTLKNLKAWTAMSKQLYVWHYGISFGHYLMPFPNLSAVGPQMQLCKRLGIRGVMWQTGDSRSIGADIAPLRAYVLARLLWNPDIPVRETIKEFVDGVYGAAAEPVLEYLDEIHRPFESAEHHLTCSPRVPAPFFGDEALRKCRQHLLEAREAAKGNRRLLLAIRRFELGVEYLSLWNEKALLPPKEKTSRLPHISPATSGEQLGKIRDFIRSCRGLKIARLGESLTLSELSKTIPFAATTVTPTHPFLLINRHEISDLRKKVEHEPWRSVFAKIIFAANRGRASRSYYETALAYAVTEKPRYLSKIRAALLHAADAFKGQSSEKRLSVATYHEGPRFGNAEFAYDIVHDALTREERKRIEAWLRQACEEALIHLATARTNPNMKAVAACEIGRKGCVIGEGRFVEWAKEEFKARIDRLRDTGFWREPPTYVYNVLASLTALAEAVLRYDGTDLYRYRSPGGHTLKSLLDSEIRVAYPIERTGVGRGSIRRLAFGHGATRPPSSGTSDFFLINSPDRPWHRSANSFQGILEVFHKRFNNPAYAWLLSLNPKRDEHAYQLGYPLMTHGEEIDGNVLPPPAPSGVYPEMGFAFLRADESPGYWSGRGMAAYLQIHGNYFHRTRGEDFQLILSGQGRLLYPQFTVVNYEPPPYKWTEHPIGHNTVVIDGAQFDRVASQEVERTERHHFGKLAKFVAATGNVTAGVKQTRALVMTQDYLADMFALSSDRPHTYDWALHGIGKLRASHLSQFAKSSDLGHYRWIRNERRALTDGLWYAEWLQRGGGVMPGVGRYGREWFGDSVGIRTWMLPRSGTMVYMGDGPRLAPPYGRELGNPEGALPMVIARRKTRATVFAAIHDAFDVKDGPCVGSVRKVVSNQDACALRVDGLEFSDRLMVSFTDTGRATSIRSQDDSNEQFTFKNFGFLRWSEGQDDAEEQNLSKIRARRLTVEGDVLAFSVFAPFTKGEIFKLNGKDASCTRTGNYLLYKTEASALQDKERDRRAKIPMAHDFVLSFVHDELGVHKGNTTEARLNVTSTGHGIGESKIVFEASAGIALAPEGLTIRDLKIGETREWPLKITVARDAPDQGMVAARCLHWNQGHASIKVRVNSGLTIEEDEPDSYMPDAKELRFPGFEDGIHDYLVKAPGYIVRVNRETGSVVSLQDRTGRAWTRGPGGYFRRGKKHIGSCFDWWGEVEKEERQADTIRFSFATGLHVEYRFREDDWDVSVSGPDSGPVPARLKGNFSFLLLNGSHFTWSDGASVRTTNDGFVGHAKSRKKTTGFLFEQPRLSEHSLAISWTGGGCEVQLDGYHHNLSVMNYCGDKSRTWRVAFLSPEEAAAWRNRHRPKDAWLSAVRTGNLAMDGSFEIVGQDSPWDFTKEAAHKPSRSTGAPGQCAEISATGAWISQKSIRLVPGRRTVMRLRFKAGSRGRIDIILEDPVRNGHFEWKDVLLPLRALDDSGNPLSSSGPHHWNTSHRRGLSINFRNAVSEWTPIEFGFTVKEAGHPIRLLIRNGIGRQEADRRILIDDVYLGQESIDEK